MVTRYIGIDFGTSSSVVYTKDFQNDGTDAKPQPMLVNGNPVIPSVAFVINDDFGSAENFIFGQAAEICQIDGNIYRNFKLDLISTDNECAERARQLVSNYFKWLKVCYDDQELYMGSCEKEETFVSFPVKWPENLREFMKGAATEAGFKNVHGMDEASAAIQGLLYSNHDTLQRYGVLKKNQQLRIMLLDMGAGTSDIIFGIYDTSTKKLQVIDTYPGIGNAVLYGGREFDESVCNFIGDYLKDNGIHYDETADRERLLCDCKCWKENTLSPCLRNRQEIAKVPPFVMMLTTHLGNSRTQFPTIDRSFFETRFADNIDVFANLIENALDSVAAQNPTTNFKDDVDIVILTGGHSQWYFVKELLSGTMHTSLGKDISFPKIKANPEKLLQLPRPSETVALGLVNSGVDISLADTSDYNIWFRAMIGDEECPPLLIVPKNELLPYKNNEIVYTESLNCCQYVLTSCDFDFDLFVKYSILVSRDSLENAQSYEDEFRVSCKNSKVKLGYRGAEFAAISKGVKAFQIKAQATVAIKITMTEDQDIELQGLFLGDRHEDRRFAKRLALRKGGSANAV